MWVRNIRIKWIKPCDSSCQSPQSHKCTSTTVSPGMNGHSFYLFVWRWNNMPFFLSLSVDAVGVRERVIWVFQLCILCASDRQSWLCFQYVFDTQVCIIFLAEYTMVFRFLASTPELKKKKKQKQKKKKSYFNSLGAFFSYTTRFA